MGLVVGIYGLVHVFGGKQSLCKGKIWKTVAIVLTFSEKSDLIVKRGPLIELEREYVSMWLSKLKFGIPSLFTTNIFLS